MHTFSDTGAGVPAFLAKLWRLVDDPDTNNLICWSKDGRSFIIQNQAQFARELLPLNYKHNNMASFIRQLNMYGFHKITSIDNGGLKFDRDEMEFSHPCFKRNCPYLLEHIKRKIANTKSIDDKAIKPEAVSKVLQDVKAMRGRQDSLDSRFSVMKQENEALWREIASLRQKHAKQQQIVNKLIQFLITIVQPSRNMSGVKRHMQLMINDKPEDEKMRKTSESETDCGPVIHELGEELLDEVAEAENEADLIDHNSPYAKYTPTRHDTETPSPNIERPHSNISQISQNYDYSNLSADDAFNADATTDTGRPDSVNTNVIQSVNPDGSRIVYHVTEVPDAQLNEIATLVTPNYDEDNVLTTPMVREQMARSQQLKQKNKQRRKKQDDEAKCEDKTFASSSAIAPKLQRSIKQQQPTLLVAPNTGERENKLLIKAEREIDPMIFLNVYPEGCVLSAEPQIMSPNISADSPQSNAADIIGTLSPMPTNAASVLDNTPNLYSPNSFIAGDIPADIFEDSALISGDQVDFANSFKLNQQQQFGRTTTSSGKFSNYSAGTGNNGAGVNTAVTGGASTSAAAAAAASAPGIPSSQGKNGSNLTVAKFKNEDISRLSTPDDVHGHLENVQDELETLKDLLRGDGYSLDTNTLMGSGTAATLNNNRISLSQALDTDFFNKLFNDSDILGPYGLGSFTGDINEKKGSELINYQPMCDLSDIFNMSDDKADMEADADSPAVPNIPHQIEPQSSVLNTPYHD